MVTFLSLPFSAADVCEIQVGLQAKVTPADLSRAFWTSSVLATERKILAAARAGVSRTDDEICKMEFDIGDQVGPFVVVGKTESEVLYCWDKNIGGHSWLAISDDGKVQFGSTLDENAVVQAVMPLHLLYARICLASARRQLEANIKCD